MFGAALICVFASFFRVLCCFGALNDSRSSLSLESDAEVFCGRLRFGDDPFVAGLMN